MAFEEYVYEGMERLRRGFTTGTCAALAAKAATRWLVSGIESTEVSVETPAGIRVDVPVTCERDGTSVCATVTKDAGDDYDATNGIHVRVRVSPIPQGIAIDGGVGVGRVTEPGLDQPVGAAAINSAPRAQIAQAIREECEAADYSHGVSAIVEVPEGAEIGAKTFNPHIGVEGGISILGTTGIVEPRSLSALADALKVEVRSCAAQGNDRLVIVPGNLGEQFAKDLGIPQSIPVITCANFIGKTLDFAVQNKFSHVLLVGHIGKLVKVAGGIMDTHSRMADGRREILCAHAACVGCNTETARALMSAATTDACLEILEEVGIRDAVLARIANEIQTHLDRRVAGAYAVGTAVFSSKAGLLCMSKNAQNIIDEWKRNA